MAKKRNGFFYGFGVGEGFGCGSLGGKEGGGWGMGCATGPIRMPGSGKSCGRGYPGSIGMGIANGSGQGTYTTDPDFLKGIGYGEGNSLGSGEDKGCGDG